MTPSQPTILAVFAHPDDEAFSVGGTLAHYAQKGVRVVLACATRGEAGKITDPSMTITDLGQHREAELKRATAELGIPDPVFLDYHDSGRYERTRYDDELALMNVNPFAAELKIRELIDSVRPDIMITFDPHGGYGHIDHLIIHRAAAAAFFSSGNLGGGSLKRLYFTALGVEAAKGLARHGPGPRPRHLRRLGEHRRRGDGRVRAGGAQEGRAGGPTARRPAPTAAWGRCRKKSATRWSGGCSARRAFRSAAPARVCPPSRCAGCSTASRGLKRWTTEPPSSIGPGCVLGLFLPCRVNLT